MPLPIWEILLELSLTGFRLLNRPFIILNKLQNVLVCQLAGVNYMNIKFFDHFLVRVDKLSRTVYNSLH